MAVLNQNFRCLVARPGIRHFHTVKLLVRIVIMDEQSRYVSLSNLIVETDIRVGEAGTRSLYDEPGKIAGEQPFQIHSLIIQTVFRHRHINFITLFRHDGFNSVVYSREQIIGKIAQNQSNPRLSLILIFIFIRYIGSASLDADDQTVLLKLIQRRPHSLSGITELFLQDIFRWEFILIFDYSAGNQRSAPVI